MTAAVLVPLRRHALLALDIVTWQKSKYPFGWFPSLDQAPGVLNPNRRASPIIKTARFVLGLRRFQFLTWRPCPEHVVRPKTPRIIFQRLRLPASVRRYPTLQTYVSLERVLHACLRVKVEHLDR